MATTDAWQPPVGTHNVAIGKALQVALDALDGGPVHPTPLTEFYSVHYNHRPESFNLAKFGSIKDIRQGGPGDNSTCTFESDVAQSDDRHLYNGVLQPAKEFQCALIFDETTGTFTFEKLDCVVDLKFVRTGTAEPEGQHQNDSPTSGITASSSSPPTPPNHPYSDNVKISDVTLDFEEESPVAPISVAKLPPRNSLSGKSVVVPSASSAIPAASSAGTKGKGKRTRDAVDGKDPAPRPVKRPTLPLPKSVPKPVPAPVALSLPPPRAPTPPSVMRSPDAFRPTGTFTFDSDAEDEPLAAAPKSLSKGFTLEVDENPSLLLPEHHPFSEGLVEEEGNMDTMFDDLDDGEGDGEGEEEDGEFEVDGDPDEEADEDEDDEDGLGQLLEDAFSEQLPPPPQKIPMSMSAFAGGGDDADDADEWAESSDEDSD